MHLIPALVPETVLVSLLESNCSCLLKRRNTAIANAGVCTGNVFDQMLRSNEIANTPSSGVEGLAGRTNSKGALVKFGGQRSNSSIRNVKQTVIYFIGQNYEVILHAEITNALELLSREDFADRVVSRSG